ncbi:MAG: hypothetical protein J6J30_04250 [Clostridia bacterium]|nr:hypothetical protein [Clostridia bacterium]
MELIKKEKDWFLSDEGGNFFASLSSLEERTLYIYSYLKLVAKECFDKKNTLFKIAFFFADAVYNSNKSYSKYPNILNLQLNPFLKYLEQADEFYGNEITYIIFTAILQEKVDVQNSNEWIYNSGFLNSEDLFDKLSEKGIEYLPSHSMHMINPEEYKIKEVDNFLQLEIVWMFLK